jgi:hypothetical protein
MSSLNFKTKPHKALIARPTEDELKRMKERNRRLDLILEGQ